MCTTAILRKNHPTQPQPNVTNTHTTKSIGKTLVDALDHFVAIDALTPQLANKIILNFDVAIMDALAERKTEAKLTFKVSLPYFLFRKKNPPQAKI